MTERQKPMTWHDCYEEQLSVHKTDCEGDWSGLCGEQKLCVQGEEERGWGVWGEKAELISYNPSSSPERDW